MSLITTPKFFYKKSIIPYFMIPLSLVFGILVMIVYLCGIRRKKLDHAKTICVGNFIAGGSGKTPVCIAIAKHLIDKGYKCCFLTCGYGRKDKKDHFIGKNNPANLSAEIVGDEPLLLANIADVFVVKKRHILPSIIDEYDYVVCDDDLWDNSLKYDVKIAVLSQRSGFGNGFILPAGPLRTFAFLANIFSDFVIVVQDLNLDKKLDTRDMIAHKYLSDKTVKTYLNCFAKKKKLIYAKLYHDAKYNKNEKYLAFAGLANNKKFFSMLENDGLNLVCKQSFPDHYFYTPSDIWQLREVAEVKGLRLITTEKDFVKINGTISDLDIVKIELILEGFENVLNFIGITD